MNKMSHGGRAALACGAALLGLLAGGAQAAPKPYCGVLTNGYGPFDYRDQGNAPQLYLVEMAHFTDDVEQGRRGNTGSVGGDLDYTLRAFPNHARALATMGRLGIHDKSVQLTGAKYPVECYFVRALEFQPDDGIVHAEYATYLQATGRAPAALAELRTAVQLQPQDAAVNYNLGLMYYKSKDYEQANAYGHKAYELGFPLPGLKQLLTTAGHWHDVPPAAKEAAQPDADAKPEPKPEVQPEIKPDRKPAPAPGARP